MIKKILPKNISTSSHNNPTISSQKNQNVFSNPVIRREKVYPQNQNYHPSSINIIPSYDRKSRYPALRDVSNLLRQEEPVQQKCQKYLKSQTSLNDLSEIIPVEMSSSKKKDTNLRLQFMQNFDKMSRQNFTYSKQILPNYRQNIFSYPESLNNSNHKQSVKKESFRQGNESKCQLEDFQILDIYATSLIDINRSINKDEKQQQRQTQQKKFGGIRRNTKPLPKQVSQNFNQFHNNQPQLQSSKEPKPNITNLLNIQYPKKQQYDYFIQDSIKNCAQQLFNHLSFDKITISQRQIQNFPFNCQLKILLGPLLMKFKQKKYLNMTFQQFYHEFSLILRDFSAKQKEQIIQKIQSQKFYTQKSDYDQCQEDQHILKAEQYIYRCQQRQIKEQESERGTTEDRLKRLSSKVDSFLNKINQHQNKDIQYFTQLHDDSQYGYEIEIPKKQKLSTLMSRLSEIQQISGDSEDMFSRNNTERSEKSQICPNKNVYVNDTTLVQQESECLFQQSCMRQSMSDKYNNDQIQFRQLLSYSQSFEQSNRQQLADLLQESLLIEKTLPNTLSHSRQNFPPSRSSSLYNSRSYVHSDHSEYRRSSRYMPDSLSSQNKQQSLFPTPIKSINLSFNQLGKYLD